LTFIHKTFEIYSFLSLHFVITHFDVGSIKH